MSQTPSVHKLVATRYGQFLINVHDMYIGKSLDLYGEWSFAEVALFAQIVRKGDVVVEAGANMGSHTVFLSRQVAGSAQGQASQHGQVLAFEPSRYTHSMLCTNLMLNECLNVRALQQCVGEVSTQAQFPVLSPVHANNFGAASLMRTANMNTEPVTQIHLDSISFARLDFIKADIEGYEPNLLMGAKNTIAQHRPVIYLEIGMVKGNATGNRDQLLGLLEPMGCSCYYYLTPIFNPNNFKSNGNNVFANQISVDMLAVPNEKVQVQGLTQAHRDDTHFTYREGAGITASTIAWNHAKISFKQENPLGKTFS